MANLIITIIAIALVAVAAIAGAFYGSSAYINSMTKAKAAEIISKMRQIKQAALLWQLNNPTQGSYPITDPTGVVADCNADNNSVMECWSNVLPYNNLYLNGIQSEATYVGVSTTTRGEAGGFDTDISYGSYGIHKGDIDNGFNSAFVKIQSMPSGWPNSNPVWYVRWFVGVTGYATYHTSGSPTLIEAQMFIARLCHQINQQMGFEKADGTYPSLPLDTAGGAVTMNNSVLTGTSMVLGLPYAGSNGAANLCTMQQNSTTLNQINFLIPL